MLKQDGRSIVNIPMMIPNQFLTTNFFVPVASHPLISRPRLFVKLQKSLQYPLTLISAPAGFGKTMLLSTWTQSLPANAPQIVWISLDMRENDPGQFWTCILAALNRQQPERFRSLLRSQQSQKVPSLNYILTALINLLAEDTKQILLILDDYQVITEQKVHTSLTYLVEHLPPSLRIILATRADPPLPLPLFRTRRKMLEVRTNQLRCTVEEAKAFFHEVIGMDLSDEVVQEVTDRTEGWLVGLQLIGLSLQKHPDPSRLLEEMNGSQNEILAYLTEEVLRQQPEDVQTFLQSTSILERLTASLCDAVMARDGSQAMLKQLEQANLFLVSLDEKCQWYRYHKLFAEALRSRLEQTQGDFMHTLHSRASIWYAEHNALTEAIQHAFRAHQWQQAADLIEHLPLMSLTCGANEHTLVTFREWLEQLPADIVSSRPGLCLVSVQMWWAVAPHPILEAWLNAAEAGLTTTTSLTIQTEAHALPSTHPLQALQDQQEDLLGDVAAFRVFVRSYKQDGETILSLSQQALDLLSADNYIGRSLVSSAQAVAYYTYSNDTEAAIQSGLNAGSLAQIAEKPALAISALGTTVLSMIGAGQLHAAQQLAQRAIQMGKTQSGNVLFPEVGWPALLEADILREWNERDSALQLAEEARSLCEQTTSLTSLLYLLCRCAIWLRISLSYGDLGTACTALRQFERIGSRMNRPTYLYFRAFFTTIDQVRLWLACEELDRATRWVQGLEGGEWYGTPFAREREEVAYARILLAKKQPTAALERLESALVRASMGQRWNHVIEIRLLQALAYQMRQQERQALDALSQGVHLAEPEGYIRSFVDEGLEMATLLSQLRMRQSKYGPTPYVDMLLAAFHPQSTEPESQPPLVEQQAKTEPQSKTDQRAKVQPLLDPLTEREQQVLEYIAKGASNQQIAHELVIAIDTVKRHVSQILSKLDVQNRLQAVRKAQDLGLVN